MRAWRLRLFDEQGDTVSWSTAMMRVAGAYVSAQLLGLGYLWMLIDKEKLSWHDRFSETRIVQLDRNPDQG